MNLLELGLIALNFIQFTTLTLTSGENSSFTYVETNNGSLPIILSVPHGGLEAPDAIPDRVHGCPTGETGENGKAVCKYDGDSGCSDKTLCRITTVTDSHTIEMARIISDRLAELSGGKRPFVVISHLKRTKLDPNREINNAANNQPIAMEAYNEYHNAIKAITHTIIEEFGTGILYDIHGQNHRQNSTELGYVLRKEELNSKYFNPNKSSIRYLSERFESSLSLEEIIFGPKSFGAYLEQEGYRALPSPRQPVPGKDKYYRGGYITQYRGSRDPSARVDAIQLETPSELRIEAGEEGRRKFSIALANSMYMFHQTYYQ